MRRFRNWTLLSLNDIVLARTKSPLKSAAERVRGDIVQTLSAISRHRRDGPSGSAPAPKRAARTGSHVATGGNRIEVKPPKVYAYDVRTAIQEALERQAERSAGRVQLEVHDGSVGVSGVVHSWAEKRAVLGAATGTPGVLRVEDHLRIQSYSV